MITWLFEKLEQENGAIEIASNTFGLHGTFTLNWCVKRQKKKER